MVNLLFDSEMLTVSSLLGAVSRSWLICKPEHGSANCAVNVQDSGRIDVLTILHKRAALPSLQTGSMRQMLCMSDIRTKLKTPERGSIFIPHDVNSQSSKHKSTV